MPEQTPRIERIHSYLDVLLENLAFMKPQMHEAMSGYALVVGDFDPSLQEAHLLEWPDAVEDPPRDYIGFDYYQAMKDKSTASSTYIRKRYEEASRDMTGNGVIDFLKLVDVTEKEALLIKDFIANRGHFIGTASQEILENFEVWIQAAIVQTKRLYKEFDAAMQAGNPTGEAGSSSATAEEARRSQALLKVSLNRYNDSIVKNLAALDRGFAEHAKAFYHKFLQGWVDASNAQASISDEAELSLLVADQERRIALYQQKLDALVDQLVARDTARKRIHALASQGKPMPSYGPAVMVQDADTSVEAEYLDQLAASSADFQWSGTHDRLSDLEEGDQHPQYLLEEGGTITGDISAEDGVTVDGVDVSEHRHTAADGSARVHGDDILGETLGDKVVDGETKPPRPEGLTVNRTDLNVVSPGINVADTHLAWNGDTEYTYEIEILHIPGEE